ncbi:MAG: hypothetical protein AB7T22_10845 [Calditrichaceae bacterium]
MTSDEIVKIYVSKNLLIKALTESKHYGAVSLPWTINRMQYDLTRRGFEKRLRNIVLGKLPEIFIREAFHRLNIPADFNKGSTPYWQSDLFDLMICINGESEEWDIKSLNMDLEKVKTDEIVDLPVLVPNNYDMDQWAKRGKCAYSMSRRKRYLFTFLNSFGLNVPLSQEQFQNFQKIVANKAYYENQKDYILRMIGPIEVTMDKNETYMLITGCAGPEEWQFFDDIPPGSKFLNGLFATRIKNKGCAVRDLPAARNLLRFDKKIFVL